MKKTLAEVQDQIRIKEAGGDLCDVDITALRSKSMRNMWKTQCKGKETKHWSNIKGKAKKSIWSKAAQRAAGGRGRLYNSVEEGQLDQNLVDLMSKPMELMMKAAERGKWKEVLAYYKELGRIIK